MAHAFARLVGAWAALPDRVRDRLAGAAVGLPALAVLLVAAWLEPDPAGVGTHRQLGLSGCTVLTLTGWPCPMCGMTTTFAHLVRLHLLRGAYNQPFGVVLFAATALAAGAGIADLAWPRGRMRRLGRWVLDHDLLVSGVILVGMALGWVWKVALLRGPLPPHP